MTPTDLQAQKSKAGHIVLHKEWLCTDCGNVYPYRRGHKKPKECQYCASMREAGR